MEQLEIEYQNILKLINKSNDRTQQSRLWNEANKIRRKILRGMDSEYAGTLADNRWLIGDRE